MTGDRRSARAAGRRTGDPPARATGAAELRALHRPGDPLLLPNAWDAASARAVEAAGFPAVATSSAALAESLGYADGQAAPVGEVLDAVARIARAVTVPVTADLERGYGMAPAELVERLAATGAVGCNLEDSHPGVGTLVPPDEQAAMLHEVRVAAERAGVDLVLNARIDVFLAGAPADAATLADAVDRARRYLAAGADCVYPILLTDPAAIRTFTREVDGPVNILFRDTVPMPSPAELAQCGVARISFGPGLFRRMWTHLSTMLDRIRAGQDPYA